MRERSSVDGRVGIGRGAKWSRSKYSEIPMCVEEVENERISEERHQ